MFSAQSGAALANAGCLEGAAAIWSLWHGYLVEPSGQRLVSFLNAHGIPIIELHTSGHASIGDLQRLATALHPDRVVPIHTFAAGRYHELFDRVTEEKDGAWWKV